jgi:hypothetical protein
LCCVTTSFADHEFPQVAETNTPQRMDVTWECWLYYENN